MGPIVHAGPPELKAFREHLFLRAPNFFTGDPDVKAKPEPLQKKRNP
jgi:hypothetical protein